MRLKIEHGEKTLGLLFKTTYPTISIEILLSDEEQHIIHESHFKNDVIFELPPPANVKDGNPTGWYVRVKDLLKPMPEYLCVSLSEAKEMEDVWINTLEQFKQLLNDNAEIETKTKVIDFE